MGRDVRGRSNVRDKSIERSRTCSINGMFHRLATSLAKYVSSPSPEIDRSFSALSRSKPCICTVSLELSDTEKFRNSRSGRDVAVAKQPATIDESRPPDNL